MWTLTTIMYYLFFYIIYKRSQSFAISLIGLFSLITLNYFSSWYLPLTRPQIGATRYLPIILFVFVAYKLKRIDSTKVILLSSILSFWIFDSGIALIGGYLTTLTIIALHNRLKLHWLINKISFLLISFILVFISLNFIQYLLGYQFIDPSSIFTKIGEYTNLGFGMMILQYKSYIWLILLVYFSSLIVYLQDKSPGGEKQILLLTAQLSFFSSLYMVGQSQPHSILTISPLPLLNFFLLVGFLIKKITKPFIIHTIAPILFIILIVLPAYRGKESLTDYLKFKKESILKADMFKSEMLEKLENMYRKEIKLIKKHLKEEEILILSLDDTYLFYLSGKKNLLYDNPQSGIITQSGLNKALVKVIVTCPNKIVADCLYFNRCSSHYTINYYSGQIQPLLLKEIEKKCKKIYEPTICTGQLCIAESSG